MSDANSEKSRIMVCDKCFRASCWQGIFVCDEAMDAGIVEIPIEELERLDLEHSSYWEM